MAIRGAFAITLLSIALVLAIAGMSHALPRAYRTAFAICTFFPGFFVVIVLTLRIADGGLRRVSDIFDSAKEGFSAFLAWAVAMLAITTAGGILFLIFG